MFMGTKFFGGNVRLVVGLALIIAMASVSGACTDDDATDNGGNDVSVDADAEDDTNDSGEADSGDADTDVEEDTEPEEPEDPCSLIDCEDDQMCYHGQCYDTCNDYLDCNDGDDCRLGRCSADTCDDLECNDGYSCYRGQCYEECQGTQDCGVGGGITCVDGGCVPLDQQCEGLACQQVDCPADQPTTVTGTVTVPSGEFPLPKVTVYVPTTELSPLPEGATCATCDELLSGDPLLQNLTDVEGRFELPNFPVADEVPLVIQTGKWRRQVTVSGIQPCTENVLSTDLTRLPRNQAEGDIPKIAVATGGCDNLECLVRNIGLDDEEFTTTNGDGSVHMFSGSGGTGSFQGGESYTDAEEMWEDGQHLADYDVLLDSCECSATRSNKSDISLINFEYFLNQGGRAFLSHYQYVWLKDNFGDIGDVAEWNEDFSSSGSVVRPRTDHEEGAQMRDWLDVVEALDDDGDLPISQPRNSILSLNQDITTEWLYYPEETSSSFDEDVPNYFSFNLPLGTEGDDACGRAVFADLHVSSGSSLPFPGGCGSGDSISPQEMALIYMLFDLSACIAPECEPASCDEVKGQCGVHPDQCGGIVECGPCCSDVDELCNDDSHCCDGLSCNTDEGRCVE